MTDGRVEEELARWEARFSVPDYVFGKEPNYFLQSCAPLLPATGKVLAIADGEGRNGVWLAERGLDVLSIEYSDSAREKAKALAKERNVDVVFERADVHEWRYPEAAFDVVVDIFTQFSTPAQRATKWRGVRRTLRPGGLLILQGYTPKQLQYGTGGPKVVEQLYTRAMLEAAFGDLRNLTIVEEEREMHEGAAHAGMSAVINLTGWK
jgi:SAM-dependent methyltransferase